MAGSSGLVERCLTCTRGSRTESHHGQLCVYCVTLQPLAHAAYPYCTGVLVDSAFYLPCHVKMIISVMAETVGADVKCLQTNSWPTHNAWSECWRTLCTVLYSSHKPHKLFWWLCHYCSIVLSISVISTNMSGAFPLMTITITCGPIPLMHAHVTSFNHKTLVTKSH